MDHLTRSSRNTFARLSLDKSTLLRTDQAREVAEAVRTGLDAAALSSEQRHRMERDLVADVAALEALG